MDLCIQLPAQREALESHSPGHVNVSRTTHSSYRLSELLTSITVRGSTFNRSSYRLDRSSSHCPQAEQPRKISPKEATRRPQEAFSSRLRLLRSRLSRFRKGVADVRYAHTSALRWHRYTGPCQSVVALLCQENCHPCQDGMLRMLSNRGPSDPGVRTRFLASTLR